MTFEPFKPVVPVSETWRLTARARLDTLTKPIGSLGRLEDLAAQVVAIRQERWSDVLSKMVCVFAADHGITEEGVSAYPSEVTRQMLLNFVSGKSAITVLSKAQNVVFKVVNVGVKGGLEGLENCLNRVVRESTANFRRGPAMTRAELERALLVGREMADAAHAAGVNLVAAGEMGIGNTTSATAITAALTGASVAEVTGTGTGLSENAKLHKMNVIAESLTLHFGPETQADADPLAILHKVGGLEIAAMTGFYLQAAYHRMVIVLDGFIATAAAACAAGLEPLVLGYMIAGHQSQEPGHGILLKWLNLKPLLALDMRLGEGTGAVLAMPLVEAALGLYGNMATFAEASVSEAT